MDHIDTNNFYENFGKSALILPAEDNRTIAKMMRLSNKIVRNTEKIIESRFDFKIIEWRILSLISENDTIRLQSVIDTYMLVPNDVFVHAMKLQNRGYIQFLADDIFAPTSLTNKGHETAGIIKSFLMSYRQDLYSKLTQEGFAQFQEILNGLEFLFDEEFENIKPKELKIDELVEVVASAT